MYLKLIQYIMYKVITTLYQVCLNIKIINALSDVSLLLWMFIYVCFELLFKRVTKAHSVPHAKFSVSKRILNNKLYFHRICNLVLWVVYMSSVYLWAKTEIN